MENGGWLDEVLWVVNTDNEGDLSYLNEIIESNPAVHRKLVIPGDKLWVYSYYKAWQRLDRGKYYVKVDDDIVGLHPLTRTRKNGAKAAHAAALHGFGS